MKNIKKINDEYKGSFLKSFLFSVIIVSFFFIILELLLRISGLVKVKVLGFPDIKTYKEIVGIFNPNQDFVNIDTLKSKLPYHVHINSHGLRGKEFNLKKDPNTLRILCLGDSYTFSNYVDDEETYPSQLEKFLARGWGVKGKKIEVINAGVSGYTIIDELSYLQEKGIRVSPDLVIVGFVMNDVSDLTRKKGSWESQKETIEYWSSSPIGALREKLVNTAIYNLLREVKAYVKYITKTDKTIAEAPLFNIVTENYDEKLLKLWGKYEESLVKMIDYLNSRDIKLVLVIFPIDYQVRMGWSDHPQRFLKEMGEKLGIEVCDLLPRFKQEAKNGIPLFFTPYDGHPTKHGYNIAAWETYKFLIEKRLINDSKNYKNIKKSNKQQTY